MTIKNKNQEVLTGARKVFYTLAVLVTSAILALLMIFNLGFSAGRAFVLAEMFEFVENHPLQSLALLGAVALCLSLYVFDMRAMEHSVLNKRRNFIIPAVGLIVVMVAQILLFDKADISFSPILLCVLLTSVLVNTRAGMFINSVSAALSVLSLTLLGAYGNSDVATLNFQSTLTYFVSGAIMVILLNRVHSRVGIVCAGSVISAFSYALGFVFTFAVTASVDQSLNIAFVCALGNMASVVVFMFMLPLFETAFKVCTDFKLNEYCNFSSPLLKRLALEAPGTFSHSMVVSTLAESCAMAIGENVLLARTSAYYHDVGKLKNAMFFVENQKGYNPHDELIPSVSAKKILSHTVYGYELLKEYGFPDEICDVALQHHGTTVAKFFYNKAMLITEGNVDKAEYSYAGPKPLSKISAIVMICDAAEAAVRAVKDQPMSEVVAGIIKERLDEGQFDDCPVTLKELEIIGDTVAKVLSYIHHKRISYKENLV